MSRRLLLVLVGVALAVALYASLRSGPPPAPLAPGDGPVVFLGDSITSGHGLPLETTFAHRIGATLGVPVRNAGISGDTTEGGRRRLERDVLAHRPRLVVVELGVNDVFRRRPREGTIENLRAIVRAIRATGAPVVLVHIRLPARFGGGDGYREDLRALAAAEGARLYEDFLDGVAPELTTDGLHPDATGHARLADRLGPVVREALGRPT